MSDEEIKNEELHEEVKVIDKPISEDILITSEEPPQEASQVPQDPETPAPEGRRRGRKPRSQTEEEAPKSETTNEIITSPEALNAEAPQNISRFTVGDHVKVLPQYKISMKGYPISSSYYCIPHKILKINNNVATLEGHLCIQTSKLTK